MKPNNQEHDPYGASGKAVVARHPSGYDYGVGDGSGDQFGTGTGCGTGSGRGSASCRDNPRAYAYIGDSEGSAWGCGYG